MLVFRCGGYSFDATVYRVQDRRLSALAMAGSTEVGECSWDNRVIERLLEKMEPGPKKVVMSDKKQMNKLRRQVDAAKAALSKGSKRVTMRVRVAGEVIEETVSYQTLARLGNDILDQLKSLTLRAVSESGTAWENVDHVLLSGGAARMPFLQEAVKQWIGNRDICSLAGPEIASGGAALVAENARGTRNSMLDFQLQDVATHSYGIRGRNGADTATAPQAVIPRGTPLPATMRGSVAKHTARQSEIEFDVVELDEANPEKSAILGSCRIVNLPPGLPVGAAIEVELSLDARGILSVFAISLSTGRRFIPAYQTNLGMTADQRAHWRGWLQGLCS
jgi:molecular chaperone DnaK